MKQVRGRDAAKQTLLHHAARGGNGMKYEGYLHSSLVNSDDMIMFSFEGR